MAVAEGAHELGRAGALGAKRLLQRVLGESVDLPFNAYDHPQRLAFEDHGGTQQIFRFDLGGVLKRPNRDRFDGKEVVDLFVEVKSRTDGSDLLKEYREFLRHAAIVCTVPAYRNAWFVFYATIPFGSSKASDLSSGRLLRECARSWPEHLQDAPAADLDKRIVLVIATESFVRLITEWGRNAA